MLVAANLSLSWPVSAAQDPQPRTAISMQGEPRYPPDFKHVDYVDPDAPKGGALIEARIGSFDSVNRWIILGDTNDRVVLTYDRLMERAENEPYTLYALVAQTITVPDDRSWVEYAIDPRAKFSDELTHGWRHHNRRAGARPVT